MVLAASVPDLLRDRGVHVVSEQSLSLRPPGVALVLGCAGETAHILPVPLHPVDVKVSPATYFSRYNFERTGVDPATGLRSKNYGKV